MANHAKSGVITSGNSYPVANFSSYSIYAANGSTVTATAGASTATYTIPAGGVLTITDLADSVSVNANFLVVGLVSTTQD